MKIYGAVSILIHFLEFGIYLLLIYVVPKPAQEEFECPASDVAGVIAVIHFEDLLQLLDLLHLVGVELLSVLARLLGAGNTRFVG